ncbi:hypothetical protein GGR50DRAFT_636031, partial [Xylaria sp. CBS 124048]
MTCFQVSSFLSPLGGGFACPSHIWCAPHKVGKVGKSYSFGVCVYVYCVLCDLNRSVHISSKRVLSFSWFSWGMNAVSLFFPGHRAFFSSFFSLSLSLSL